MGVKRITPGGVGCRWIVPCSSTKSVCFLAHSKSHRLEAYDVPNDRISNEVHTTFSVFGSLDLILAYHEL
jgi:hypothetical protein